LINDGIPPAKLFPLRQIPGNGRRLPPAAVRR
jgi:hypothetical protein